jgi:cytidylate kinase
MPVVTISRQFGAGGHTLGQAVAAHLGYQLVDRDIVAQVAKEANVSGKWADAVETDTGGLLAGLVSRVMSESSIERSFGESVSEFDEKKYLPLIKQVITKVAAEGDAVLVGRGSQFILPDSEQTIKVLLVAELEDRIRFMMTNYNLTRAKAEPLVRKEEKRRIAFLKLFDKRNPDEAGLYSLVINTSRQSLKEAESLILGLVGLVADEYARPIW